MSNVNDTTLAPTAMPTASPTYEGEVTGVSEFLVTIGSAAAVALVFFVLFLVLRKRQIHIYSPALPCTASWLSSLSDDELMSKAGLAALMLIRFMRLGFVLFALLSVLGWVVLVPIYATDADGNGSGLDRISLSNVAEGSARCWASLLATYAASAAAIFLCCREFAAYADLKRRFRLIRAPETAVVVRGIPENARSDEGVRSFFAKLYGAEAILSARAVVDAKSVAEKVAERTSIARQLEVALWQIQQNSENESDERPQIAVSKTETRRVATLKEKLSCATQKGDAEEVLRAELERLNAEIAELKSSALPSTSAAVVTFTELRSALEASFVLASPEIGEWAVSPAPSPTDLLWQNLARFTFTGYFDGIVLVLPRCSRYLQSRVDRVLEVHGNKQKRCHLSKAAEEVES